MNDVNIKLIKTHKYVIMSNNNASEKNHKVV